MNVPPLYRLHAQEMLPSALGDDHLYVLTLKPEDKIIQAIFRGWNGDSELIWRKPVTLADIQMAVLLEPVSLLPPSGDAPDLIVVRIVHGNKDESLFWLSQEGSRSLYQFELDEDMVWPITYLQVSVDRSGAPVFTYTVQPVEDTWERQVQLYTPQQWTPMMLNWIAARHTAFAPLSPYMDWKHTSGMLNHLAAQPPFRGGTPGSAGSGPRG